ncbi:aminotransferase class IV [Citricoccus sp. NPDC079358]|uniref:aminotransferase class IV n=1 Tax=Citricoccus sp. NPDC079358 TaxID=3154653 RepID=UPI00344E53B2
MTESPQPAAPFVPGPGESVVVYLEPDAGPAGVGVKLRVDDPRRPAILVTDQGLTRGDGVFETMTAVAAEGAGPGSGSPLRVRKEDSHLARLATSAQALEIPLPPAADWQRAAAAGLEAFAAGNPGVDAVVKLVATRGPEGAPGGGHYVRAEAGVERLTGTYWVLVSPVSPGLVAARERGLKVLLLDRGVDSGVAERAPWLLMGTKSLSYAVNMAALRYAASQGADDVIFTSSDGQVLEGPTSTVLMARRIPQQDGSTGIELVTPLRSSGILPGTSQGTIFAAAQAAGWQLGYGPLEPSDLVDADGVWLVSSVRLVAPVTHLDGEEIPQDAELTELLNGFLAEDREPGEHGP